MSTALRVTHGHAGDVRVSSSTLSADDIAKYIQFYKTYQPPQNSRDDDGFPAGSPVATSAPSSPGFGGAAPSGATSYADDPHAVPIEEANSYYAGLISEPTLLYRTGDKWSPPQGPEVQRRKKQLISAFGGQLERPWYEGGLDDDVAKAMEGHRVFFTSLNVVRFKMVKVDGVASRDEEDDVSPFTIYIGVVPGSTAPTAAHNAAKSVQALLEKHGITDAVNIEFAEFYCRREVGPPLFKRVNYRNPLVDVIGPVTSALGLYISTEARPDAQGTMAVYLAEGGDSTRLLGLTCRHVVFGSTVPNRNYEHRSGARKEKVHLLGQRAFDRFVDSIKAKIGEHGIMLQFYEDQVEDYDQRENGDDPEDAALARTQRAENQASIDKALGKMNALESFRIQVERDWGDRSRRELGYVLRSPPVTLGFNDKHQFTEDWAVLEIDRDKLGEGFVGNKLDLGTKIGQPEFTHKVFTRSDANGSFKYPKDGLLPLRGIVTEGLMRAPDMRDRDDEPCLFVVKNGNTTGTTIGRANGFFAVNRTYKLNSVIVEGTSREWAVFNYDNESGAFSEPGDSGSIVVDIRGQIVGVLIGGGGKTERSDMTYVTPWFWILERVKENGFPNAHLNVT